MINNLTVKLLSPNPHHLAYCFHDDWVGVELPARQWEHGYYVTFPELVGYPIEDLNDVWFFDASEIEVVS